MGRLFGSGLSRLRIQVISLSMIQQTKRLIQRILLCGLLLSLLPSLTQAKDFYVSGYREIRVRTGPGEENKAFATLKTGQKMQRVNQEGDYYLVKIPDGRRGYVLKKNLTDKAPPEYRLSELEAKVKQQANEIEQLRQENNGLIEAADVQTNRETEVKTQLEHLQAERNNIQRDRNLIWFLAGAGVLLVGWLIGWRFKLRGKSRYQGLGFS